MTTFTLTIALGTGHGTTDPSIGVHTGYAFEEDEEITAYPDEGYIFSRFVVNNSNGQTISYTNPTTVSIISTTYVVVDFMKVAGVVYCDPLLVKDMMLIASDDDQYDDAIDAAIEESSRLIDVYLMPFTTTPLANPDDIIQYICANFACSRFKVRMMPTEVQIQGQLQPDNLAQVTASGFWAIGKNMMDEYIKSKYNLADTSFTWASCQDPNQVVSALSQKIITVAEARAILKAMTYSPTSLPLAEVAKIEAEIDLLECQLAKCQAETDILIAELDRMAADLTKITAENAVLTQQVVNMQADVTHLTAVNVNLVAQNAKLAAETADILEKTEQLPKRGTTFTYVDEDEEGTP